jgi:hypothetical protein
MCACGRCRWPDRRRPTVTGAELVDRAVALAEAVAVLRDPFAGEGRRPVAGAGREGPCRPRPRLVGASFREGALARPDRLEGGVGVSDEWHESTGTGCSARSRPSGASSRRCSATTTAAATPSRASSPTGPPTAWRSARPTPPAPAPHAVASGLRLGAGIGPVERPGDVADNQPGPGAGRSARTPRLLGPRREGALAIIWTQSQAWAPSLGGRFRAGPAVDDGTRWRRAYPCCRVFRRGRTAP